MNITPIILAGGTGTRLWPLSRKSYPKQFTRLMGEHSLFQQAALRCRGEQFNDPVVITNSDYRFIVVQQLQEVGIDPGLVIIEPEARDTAPAILAASILAHKKVLADTVIVMPSDHVIGDANYFCERVVEAASHAVNGNIVTFGIRPTHPETAYGYLKVGKHIEGQISELQSFVEKPDLSTAKNMLTSGGYLWNAGIFMFDPAMIYEVYKKVASDVFEAVNASLESAQEDLGFLRLGSDDWANCPKISIDYAVMEQANGLVVCQYTSDWSDLGGWQAVWQSGKQDEHGMVICGNVTSLDCENSLLRAEDSNLEVVGIGLKDIAVVAMSDAVLVVDKSRGQDVKLMVDALKEKKAAQAENLPIDHRPWGWFESLVVGERFQVKRIHVDPGASLSLQSHHHRSEHWVVVSGTARVTIEAHVQLVTENQSVYIPVGSKHRMSNPGKLPLVLIEVQTGSYFGEDDIVRYTDMYDRK